MALYACSTEHTETIANASGEDDDYAEVEAVDASGGAITRALNMTLSSFSLSIMNVKSEILLADKLRYEKPNGSFSPVGGSWRMISQEMMAIGVSPSMDILENVTMTKAAQTFDYTVPTTEQTMLKIGSNMSFTKASTKNKLSMNFVNALAQFTIKARNELKVEVDSKEYDVKIYVKGVTLHNLAAKGRFTFTGNYQGTWTPIDDVYANYSQELPSPVPLNSTSFVNVMDSIFVFLPQSPENNAWTPSGLANPPASDAISVANANHKAYIELRCAMTIERDGQTVYVWGSSDTYKSVYFPYVKKYCPKVWSAINRQAVYNLKIIKTETLDAEGAPIKPEELADENGQFENAVFIEVAPTDDYGDDNVDDWPDADIIDVTI